MVMSKEELKNIILKRWVKLRENEENVNKYYYSPNIWVPSNFIQEILDEATNELDNILHRPFGTGKDIDEWRKKWL